VYAGREKLGVYLSNTGIKDRKINKEKYSCGIFRVYLVVSKQQQQHPVASDVF
jgi:hypothetical protein